MSARRPTTGLPWPIVATTPVLATGCLQRDQALSREELSAKLSCMGEEEACRQGTQVPQLQVPLVQLGKLKNC